MLMTIEITAANIRMMRVRSFNASMNRMQQPYMLAFGGLFDPNAVSLSSTVLALIPPFSEVSSFSMMKLTPPRVSITSTSSDYSLF